MVFALKGILKISADNVIIRYILVRPNATGDAIGGHPSNIILDHVSTSWSDDEVMSLYHGEDVTIQWCIISEACGDGHNFGGIWGNWPSTTHHNLFAHNLSRNPRWDSDGGAGDNDHRNNVIYNWGYMTCYGGAGEEPVNMVANYYKAGPATESDVTDLIAKPSGGAWYVADNYVHGHPEVTADNWLGMNGGSKLDEPWPAMPINQQTAEEAYSAVLDHVGCSFPNRDEVDARIIEEVRTGTATYGDNGIINSPSEVGKGGSEPTPEPTCMDLDSDSDIDGVDLSILSNNDNLNPSDVHTIALGFGKECQD
jgi:pectate lyase